MIGAAIFAAALQGAVSRAGSGEAKRRSERLRLRVRSSAANTGIEVEAGGVVKVRMDRLRLGDRQRLSVALTGLRAETAYHLDALLGDDAVPARVAGFTTDRNGSFASAYARDIVGAPEPGIPALPGAIDFVGRVREISVVDEAERAVLTADLARPESLRYSVRRRMDNTGTVGPAAGALRIDADKDAAVFRVRAQSLRAMAPCRLTIGDIAGPATTTTNAAGVARLTQRVDDTSGLFDVRSVALADDTVGDVVLQAGGGHAGWGLPSAPPFPIPYLVPGTGFTSATAERGAIGSGPGSDAKAIARWDVVPFQTFTGELPVGVVAFHIAGIDRVEFSVEGGPWTAVRSMTLNPVTGVWEYSASLDAAALADGPVEVRAVVYPTVGVPRVLAGSIDGSLAFQNGNHSMFLAANSHGTLPQPVAHCSPAGSDATGDGSAENPYRSPGHAVGRVSAQSGSADGLTVHLAAGNYSWGPPPYPYPATSDRWIRLTPAPGVSRGEVVFDASSAAGFRTRLVHADGVTFRGSLQLTSTAPPYLADSYVWVNDCVLEGPGPGVDSGFFSTTDWTGTYFTGCDVSNNRNGIRSATFTRDCHVHDISSSPFGASPMVVNSRCADRFDSTQFHGDVFHWFQESNSLENFILYGVRAVDFDSQGVFAEVMPAAGGEGPFVTMDNVAMVDVHMSKDASSASGSWWNRSTNHLLLWNVSFPDQPFRWGQSEVGTVLENVSIVGSVFHAFSISDLPASSDVRHVHYTNPDYYLGTFPGTDVTFGDPGFKDPENGDYTPRPSSPLLGRVRSLLVPVDAAGRVRRVPDAVGAFTSP